MSKVLTYEEFAAKMWHFGAKKVVPIIDKEAEIVAIYCFLFVIFVRKWMSSWKGNSSYVAEKSFGSGLSAACCLRLEWNLVLTMLVMVLEHLMLWVVFNVLISWLFAGGPLLKKGGGWGHWHRTISPIFSKHLFRFLDTLYCLSLFFSLNHMDLYLKALCSVHFLEWIIWLYVYCKYIKSIFVFKQTIIWAWCLTFQYLLSMAFTLHTI